MVDAVDPGTSRAPPRRARSVLADVLARARSRQRAPRGRRRARPHRLRLAVADPRDRPQVRSHLLQRARADGHRRPTSCSPLLGAAVRVGARRTSPSCSTASGRGWPRAGSCRSAACGWSPTPTCPAGRRWPDSSSPASGSSARSSASSPTTSGCPTRSATPRRYPRSPPRRAPAGSSPRRSSWNETNRMPAPHLPVGGHRRNPALHALPAGRHLQLRALRRTISPAPSASSPRRAGRRRRWCRSAGATAAVAPPARCSPPRTARAVLEGSPRVELARPAAFFGPPRPPSIQTRRCGAGELYLEYHRGTYTSQARTKRGNRRSEHLLREAELWATTAARSARRRLPRTTRCERTGRRCCCPVPRHPARLVDRVGAPDAEQDYAEVADVLNRVVATALTSLAGDGAERLAFNAAPHARAGVPALGAATPERGLGGVRHDDRRHGRARQRPDPCGRRRRRPARLGARPAGRPGAARPRRGGATSCSCTATPRPGGTPGTSTRTTAVR